MVTAAKQADVVLNNTSIFTDSRKLDLIKALQKFTMVIKNSPEKQKYCSYCRKAGHSTKECTKKPSGFVDPIKNKNNANKNGNKKMWCKNCKMDNHNTADCGISKRASNNYNGNNQRISNRQLRSNNSRQQSQRRPLSQVVCNICGKTGHYANTCNQRQSNQQTPGSNPNTTRNNQMNRQMMTQQKPPQINPIKCYNCGRLGHIARDCRQPKQNTTNNNRNMVNTANGTNRPNIVLMNNGTNPFNSSNDDSDNLTSLGIADMYGNSDTFEQSGHLIYMQDPVNRVMCARTIDPRTGDVQITHERKTKSGYLPVTIFNGRNKSSTFTFLIDTGSTNNWIGPQAFNIIKNHAYNNRLPFTVKETNVTSQTGGNGDGMTKAQGKITIPVVLNFDCKKIPDDHITFSLLPSVGASILGEEFLDKYKGKIEFDGNG